MKNVKNSISRTLVKLGLFGSVKAVYDKLSDLNVYKKRQRLKFYSQFIKEDELCFDIGANVGNMTALFLRLKAKVVAVEPQGPCMEKLRRRFKGGGEVAFVEKALGEREGEGEMVVSKAHPLSSMSKEWIESVKKSGRFSGYAWGGGVKVPVTTMDKLIQEFGRPAFCKIDVEGFEYQVIKGLSQPVRTINFEVTPEFAESAIKCIEHLSRLGKVEFNYSLGDTPRLELPEWTSPENISQIITSLPAKNMAPSGTILETFTRFTLP